MRTFSLLKVASLALVLAAPLGSVAFAGDHSGDQWRDDGDGRQVATTYAQSSPALVRLEQRVYRADTGHQVSQAETLNGINHQERSDLG
jgi:hypothetical protein